MNIFAYFFRIFNEFLEDIYPQLREDYYTDVNTPLINTDV